MKSPTDKPIFGQDFDIKVLEGLVADLGGSAAFCNMMAWSTSDYRCGKAWRIGGSVMETPNLGAIRALRPLGTKDVC